MSDIRIGDVVNWNNEGVVAGVCDDPDFVYVRFGVDTYFLRKSALELVERPVTKVAVELTYDQLDELCFKTAVGSPSELYQTLNAARDVAYDETYG